MQLNQDTKKRINNYIFGQGPIAIIGPSSSYGLRRLWPAGLPALRHAGDQGEEGKRERRSWGSSWCSTGCWDEWRWPDGGEDGDGGAGGRLGLRAGGDSSGAGTWMVTGEGASSRRRKPPGDGGFVRRRPDAAN